jgi:hypothetical protein
MGMSLFEVLGVAGIAIAMLAYLPQVVRLGESAALPG